MTTFNVSHCNDHVLSSRGVLLRRVQFTATVSWALACRVFGQHTEMPGELQKDVLYVEDSFWEDLEVFDNDSLKRVVDDEASRSWAVLKEGNTVQVLIRNNGAEMSLQRVNMVEAAFDVAKQRATSKAWELTVSQVITEDGQPCDESGESRIEGPGFSRFLSSFTYWTSKSRDFWAKQEIKAKSN